MVYPNPETNSYMATSHLKKISWLECEFLPKLGKRENPSGANSLVLVDTIVLGGSFVGLVLGIICRIL